MVNTERDLKGAGRPAQPRLRISGVSAACQSCACTQSGRKLICLAASRAPAQSRAKRLWLSR